ncbi:N,N-dimethylaniline monooxygenase [Aureococcus anophagefferens]|uniref:N,N-dimethylaniline monooxygenase n=1 Tax=Aureococcus anophagefferens TaxID=44056 RepID=A0ABR1GAA8_AURAN
MTYAPTQVYDGVCVASGNFQTAKVPTFPGIDGFKGELVHASEYKRPDQFEGKNVVVIGLGESGADLAREVASVAKNAYACVRSLPAIIPRLPNYKDPTDAFTFRAHHFAYTTAVSERFGVCYDPRLEKKLWGCGKLSSIAINAVCSGMVFGMFLKLKIYDGVVTRLKHLITGDYSAGPNSIGNEGEARKNNSMIDVKAEADEAIEEHFEAWHRINAGNYFGGVLRHPLNLQLKASGLEKINATSVTFGSGETVDCDAIVFCTGYKDQFQFFTDPKLRVFPDGNVRNMYRHAIRLDAPNLAFIGWVRPTSGGVPACSEMIARYYAALVAGGAARPDDAFVLLPFMADNMPKEITDNDKNYTYGFDIKRRHAHLAELLGKGAKAM